MSAGVLAAGGLFTLYLQTTVREGVFTQGDLAMKYLFTRQIARDGLALDIRLPAQPWEKDLWARGLHPFPFAVRSLHGREYLYYPVTFPMVSAPLYRAWGFRGLYVLPLASTWAIWLAFVGLARRYGLREPWRAVLLLVLIFASPLTFYSATFWEHTLAVALAFAPVAFALSPPSGAPLARAGSFALGALLGAAGWFREEMLFLAGLTTVVLALPERLRRLGPLAVSRWPFIAGLTTTVACFLAANSAIYGMPLGLHATDFVQWLSQWGRARDAAAFLTGSLGRHYPIGAALLALLALSWWNRGWAAVTRPAALLMLCLAFCVAVPVLAHHEGGRQFGPRFLLVVFPLSALGGGLLVQDALERAGTRTQWAALLVLCVLVFFGVTANSVEGEHHLRVNYGRRRVSYDAVRDSEARAVAVSHEFVAQQFTDLVGPKTLFLTLHAAELKLLGLELARHGDQRLLYLCYPQYPCGPFAALPPELTLQADGRPCLRFHKRGQFDRYVVYDGVVLATPRAAVPPP